jgi:hypothetical protein
MIEVHLEKNEVVGRSVHAAGDLEIRLRVPSDWTTSKRLDLARLLARWIEEIRIGCTTRFTVVGELATWDEGRILIRLARRRVAARLLLSSPPLLEKDVQVILEGKEDEFGFVLESMIQVATDAPPAQIHQILFNDPPAPPLGWEATARQRCCARFVQANDDKRLAVAMGMIHGPTDWMPFLQVAKFDKNGILRGETWLQGPPLDQFPGRWLMEACELAHVLSHGFRRGEVVWELNTPWLRFGDRAMFPSLRALANWIQGKRA